MVAWRLAISVLSCVLSWLSWFLYVYWLVILCMMWCDFVWWLFILCMRVELKVIYFFSWLEVRMWYLKLWLDLKLSNFCKKYLNLFWLLGWMKLVSLYWEGVVLFLFVVIFSKVCVDWLVFLMWLVLLRMISELDMFLNRLLYWVMFFLSYFCIWLINCCCFFRWVWIM